MMARSRIDTGQSGGAIAPSCRDPAGDRASTAGDRRATTLCANVSDWYHPTAPAAAILTIRVFALRGERRPARSAAKMWGAGDRERSKGEVGAVTIEPQLECTLASPSGSGKVGPRRPRLRLLAVGGATLLGAVVLSVGLAPASRVGADIIIDPNLPTDPTTVPTTVPDTTPPTTPPTTAPPPTTTTTAPPTTTTTRPPVITSRPTTTTTRVTTTTSRPATRTGDTGGTSTSVATGTSTSAGVRIPSAQGKVLAAKAKREAIQLRGASPLPGLAPARGGSLPVDVSPRVITRKTAGGRSADVTPLDRRATLGGQGGNSLMTLGLILAVALLLGLVAWRVIAGRRRRPRAAFGAPLFVDRDATEIEVRAALIAMLADGPIDVSGSDCRSLQMLVKVAALEGLEIRDPEGYIPRASERLVVAFGFVPDRKRLPLHWRVTVGHRSVAIPDGAQYLMQETGPEGLGRRLAFSPGTPLDLWDGDCL